MDHDLIYYLKEGKESAYKKIFLEYYRPLTAFACKYLKDLNASREISQTVFIKLFEKRNSIEIKSDLKAYLYKITYHECLNYINSNRTRLSHYEKYFFETENSFTYQKYLEQTEEEYRIYKTIEKLPSRCRHIFMLSRFEEKKNKDIAAELNISVRTVETQISKALKIIKAEIYFIALALTTNFLNF